MHFKLAIVAASVAAVLPPPANAETHKYLTPAEEGKESVAYFEESHILKDGDDIILNNWGSRFVLSKMPNDLRKLFKNPRCQAGWNKNVLFGFS